MKEKEYQFETEFLVRDYEVDLQGVVNNANYMHYLEHARHLFLLSKGVDFAAMHDEGKDLIVTRAELKYRSPLKSKDRFIIKQYVLKEGHVQIAFIQDIFRLPDNKPVLSAKITGACLNGGKPVVPDEVLRALNL
ncbi:MAG: acyl-CoA thioesterase [Marinilabiliaceae bacterium]|jgi:acyl-CoA thioester hydrolase|nr:acyl-CoA thioesterase [Marinilabiliaceae bacterium]